MPLSEARKRWDKENTVVFSVKFFNKSDAEILALFDRELERGNKKARVIKTALEEYIQNHPEL